MGYSEIDRTLYVSKSLEASGNESEGGQSNASDGHGVGHAFPLLSVLGGLDLIVSRDSFRCHSTVPNGPRWGSG